LAKADFILDNSGSRDDLKRQVERLHLTLKDSA
jgi:dephospho-CoA kinase